MSPIEAFLTTMDLIPHQLTRAGATIHTWTGGPAAAPLVVLTHGATVDHREWDATLPVTGRMAGAFCRWTLPRRASSATIGVPYGGRAQGPAPTPGGDPRAGGRPDRTMGGVTHEKAVIL